MILLCKNRKVLATLRCRRVVIIFLVLAQKPFASRDSDPSGKMTHYDWLNPTLHTKLAVMEQALVGVMQPSVPFGGLSSNSSSS